MDLFDIMKQGGYEQVIFNFDRETGMRAIIAIHDSTLAKPLVVCALVNYGSLEEALRDALRLGQSDDVQMCGCG